MRVSAGSTLNPLPWRNRVLVQTSAPLPAVCCVPRPTTPPLDSEFPMFGPRWDWLSLASEG